MATIKNVSSMNKRLTAISLNRLISNICEMYTVSSNGKNRKSCVKSGVEIYVRVKEWIKASCNQKEEKERLTGGMYDLMVYLREVCYDCVSICSLFLVLYLDEPQWVVLDETESYLRI